MIRRLIAACVLLAASVFLMLLARDVWHWQRAMANADARASVGAVSPATWNAHAMLPHDLARRLLGLERRHRSTAAPATLADGAAGRQRGDAEDLQGARAVVETALQRSGRDLGSPAARASRPTCSVSFATPTLRPPTRWRARKRRRPERANEHSRHRRPRALEQFLLGVRLDPNDDNAQRNLELMLRQPAPPQHKERPARRRRRPRRQKGVRCAGTPGTATERLHLTFLTPVGALLALTAVVPVAALLVGESRARRARHALHLAPPPRRLYASTALALALVRVLLGLALAQPVLRSEEKQRVRSDAQIFYVFDSELDAGVARPSQPDAAGTSARDRAQDAARPHRRAVGRRDDDGSCVAEHLPDR